MKNRDRFEILSLILQVANGGGNNTTRTRIMNMTLLGYKQMKEHLVFLTERDLLYYYTESGTFKTSEKGMRFLQIYGRMEDMMRLQEQKQQERLEKTTTTTTTALDVEGSIYATREITTITLSI